MAADSEKTIGRDAALARFFTSFLGAGRLPVAPGTWGSAPAAVVFGLMVHLHVQGWITGLVMLIIMLAAAAVCIILSPAVIAATGRKDPGEIVVDEVAGQALTLLFAPFAAGGALTWHAAVVGFAAFRVFDILKPWPCRRLEQLPAGYGILMDDLMAGVYAAVVLQLCIYFFGG